MSLIREIFSKIRDTTGGVINPATKENQTNWNQIVQARLYDGAWNPINSLDWAINIHDADVHHESVNHFFYKNLLNYTLASPITKWDTSITFTDATWLAIWDFLHITDSSNNNHEHCFLEVTSIAWAPTIVVDRPIDKNYLVATTTITEVQRIMNLNGSLASPISFILLPSSWEVWHITSLNFSILDNVAMDDNTFGWLTKLTNWVVIRQIDSTNWIQETLSVWRRNQSFINDWFDITYSTKAPSGFYGVNWILDIHNRYWSIVRLANTSTETVYLEILIQDNLTLLDDFNIKAHWHIEST